MVGRRVNTPPNGDEPLLAENNTVPDLERIGQFVHERTKRLQTIIQKTSISIQMNRVHHIFSNSDVMFCIKCLNDIQEIINDLETNITEDSIQTLQHAVTWLAKIISNYGTQDIEDLLYLAYGSNYTPFSYHPSIPLDKYDPRILEAKYELLVNYFHPTGYYTLSWSQTPTLEQTTTLTYCSNKNGANGVPSYERYPSIECFDMIYDHESLFKKIHGARVVFHCEKSKKTIHVTGWLDDMMPEFISNNPYIEWYHTYKDTYTPHQSFSEADHILWDNVNELLTLKDFLVYGVEDIHDRMRIVRIEIAQAKSAQIDHTVSRFLTLDLFHRRNMLMNLMTMIEDAEMQYVAYLLYDLVETNTNGELLDTSNHSLVYDSFPCKYKQRFKDTMQQTLHFSQDIDMKRTPQISLEHQIMLLKAPDQVKEKAMTKYKETKGKTDEQGTKARQYLEGLVKIPFGIYRKEGILSCIESINTHFLDIFAMYQDNVASFPTIPKKTKYTKYEIKKYQDIIQKHLETIIDQSIHHLLETAKKEVLVKVITSLHLSIESKKSKKGLIEYIRAVLPYTNIVKKAMIFDSWNTKTIMRIPAQKISRQLTVLRNDVESIEKEMCEIHDRLDKSIYGHLGAKNQIMKIISQWINGEESGYCFGFEGSPGIGKTSLAKKGIAQCLQDACGKSRPFAFIALGGSCNGSYLEGHGYTYVNSTWGRIADIVMESKCMNPIIYVDELDKVSKTEQGREIIGILTHLIDSTQNDSFQDKYFSGIPLDLSKALFIFSYNDPDNIDRILLDRIHRIRFDNLTIEDKLVIVDKYILPEINRKMGFSDDVVILQKDVIEHIILTYTSEPGVRKLKELLFDLYGEINIELLQSSRDITFPIEVGVDDIDGHYFKKHIRINETMIRDKNMVGTINGLWANALGRGGIIPIEAVFFPTTTFLELKLTGSQGDVMKESMNVAKTLAWSLTPDNVKVRLLEQFEKTRSQGIHIHCPEGAVAKDGPSAGTAITVAIYSLLNNRTIDATVAITGEIDLHGSILAIGGLEMKILGGIRAGVKTFIYPSANISEFELFIEKYGDKEYVKPIRFLALDKIQEVFDHVLGKR